VQIVETQAAGRGHPRRQHLGVEDVEVEMQEHALAAHRPGHARRGHDLHPGAVRLLALGGVDRAHR